jgi:hypothetical protein
VAQDVGHFLERTAVLDKAARQNVAESMRAGMHQSSPAAGVENYFLDRR